MSALEFLPEALEELSEIAATLNQSSQISARAFVTKLRRCAARCFNILILWREREGSYRRVNFPVFPYYLAYFVRGERIIIAAIAHASRHPDFWKSRFP